jgi:hypothetical protein
MSFIETKNNLDHYLIVSLNTNGGIIDEIFLNKFRTSYRQSSTKDKADFKKYYLKRYAQYSGKMNNFIGTVAGATFAAVLDTAINGPHIFKLLIMMALGGAAGFLGGRRLHQFFRSGHYYERLDKVNQVFESVNRELKLGLTGLTADNYRLAPQLPRLLSNNPLLR